MKETIEQFSPETAANDLKNRFGQATEKDLEAIRVAMLEFSDEQEKQIREIIKNDHETANLNELLIKVDELSEQQQYDEIAAEDQERHDKASEEQSSDLNARM